MKPLATNTGGPVHNHDGPPGASNNISYNRLSTYASRINRQQDLANYKVLWIVYIIFIFHARWGCCLIDYTHGVQSVPMHPGSCDNAICYYYITGKRKSETLVRVYIRFRWRSEDSPWLEVPDIHGKISKVLANGLRITVAISSHWARFNILISCIKTVCGFVNHIATMHHEWVRIDLDRCDIILDWPVQVFASTLNLTILRRAGLMTKATQHSTICSGMCQTDWVLDSFKGKSELEKLDNQSAHQYIPMDVYVDPQTINEHFQASSIHKRWAKK